MFWSDQTHNGTHPRSNGHIYTVRKKFSKFFMSLVFVYKSMSLKRFRIEQLCPSIDSMISLVFVHYALCNRTS